MKTLTMIIGFAAVVMAGMSLAQGLWFYFILNCVTALLMKYCYDAEVRMEKWRD